MKDVTVLAVCCESLSYRDRPGTVLSIWEDNTCRAAVRLSPADVAELIGALANGIAEAGERKEFGSGVA